MALKLIDAEQRLVNAITKNMAAYFVGVTKKSNAIREDSGIIKKDASDPKISKGYVIYMGDDIVLKIRKKSSPVSGEPRQFNYRLDVSKINDSGYDKTVDISDNLLKTIATLYDKQIDKVNELIKERALEQEGKKLNDIMDEVGIPKAEAPKMM